MGILEAAAGYLCRETCNPRRQTPETRSRAPACWLFPRPPSVAPVPSESPRLRRTRPASRAPRVHARGFRAVSSLSLWPVSLGRRRGRRAALCLAASPRLGKGVHASPTHVRLRGRDDFQIFFMLLKSAALVISERRKAIHCFIPLCPERGSRGVRPLLALRCCGSVICISRRKDAPSTGLCLEAFSRV